MTLTTALATFFLDKFAGLAVEQGAKGLWGKIKDRGARKELARACAAAIEAAIVEAPSLAEDLRSASFADGVALPLVRALLERPSAIIDAETFADHYVAMFVERFSRDKGVDATLARIFQTDRAGLVRAFVAFLKSLTTELYASDHWREPQHYQTTEAMASQVSRILELVEQRDADARAARVDVARALADAEIASTEMRAWPSVIHGMRLETPAFERLIRRVTDEPAGRTLLIGDAGTGKSALLARLAPALESAGVTVFAIKADQLPASLSNLDDLARALGVDDGLDDRIAALAATRPVALLLDQLDAVSDIMDRQSHRMQLLLQLVHRLSARAHATENPLAVHVIISSRPFEAAHDARFQQLKAEAFELDLLGAEQVETMLDHLGVPAEGVDTALLQTLRRPFALKLYADIVTRSGDASDLTPAGLLDAWLAGANLGAGDERRATTDFLLALAEEMVATETLWRPADTFDLNHAASVRRAEAAGLVVRLAGKLGFSHQSWLDDFQARTFRTGRDLADYAWARQDSLFVRASILRGLERLRVRDVQGYQNALAALLGTDRTRRHLLHLIADIIATATEPLPFEITWVEHWVHRDSPLALRALGQLVRHWERWRDGLRPLLPLLMTNETFHWQAARLLAAEVRIDATHVATLIDRFWSDASRDHLVFEILELADFVGLEVQTRLRTIFGRTQIEDHTISHMVRTFVADGRFEEAAVVLVLWLETAEVGRTAHPAIYELEKLAEAAPLTLARNLLPWFVGLVARDVGEPHCVFARYPSSHWLPYGWDDRREQGSPFEAVLRSITLAGERDPQALWQLLEPLTAIEIDEVQQVIAIGLAGAGAALAREAHNYLLGDPRRLQIAQILVVTDEGQITSINGWHSQQLIRAIVPGLDDTQLMALRDLIETWSCYTDEAIAEEDPELSALRARWSDEARFPLLEALPPVLIAPQRHAEISAWRIKNPRLEPRSRDDDSMVGWVGPAMTHEEMDGASDDEILAQLDQLHDDSRGPLTSKPISRSGGVLELARSFGAFAKANPQRALALAPRLSSERHQRAAGHLVHDLANGDPHDPLAIITLILDLDRRGFSSPEWRQDAARALQRLAVTLNGLNDTVTALLESWVETSPEIIAAQITDRRRFEALSQPSDNASGDPRPTLFGAGFGMRTLPSGNFTILSAIADGLLRRQAPDCDGWAAVLERHLAFAEDPVVWTAILLWHRNSLRWADGERVTRIFNHLWKNLPETLRDVRLIGFWWRMRAQMPDEIAAGTTIWWMVSSDARARQAAGEFLTAAHLVDPGAALYGLLFGRLDRTDPAVETGILFSAAAAWREDDPTLRAGAHALLMATLPSAVGASAFALASAVNTRSEFVRDALTLELLTELPRHDEVFEAALGRRFTDALQNLLLHPGFDAVILAIVEKAVERAIGGTRARWSLGQDLVRVAIALQRSDSEIRPRAMDVYERLLDAAVYGAEEAAKASLSRQTLAQSD